MSYIAYQNKDITSKLFADRFKGKSLNVYGLRMPSVKQVLPTNIPQIKANELRIDNVFLLEDDTIAIIDYESTYKKENKHKYIQYINHVVEYYSKEWEKDISVRMIVIYTADVERSQTTYILNAGCLSLKIECAYLSELNSREISERLLEKLKNNIPFTEEELMEFIILPLTYKGNEQKNKSIKMAIDMVSQIPDEETRIFILSGIAVFTDKVIKAEYADEIRRLISMTKVGKLFEDEKMEYAKEQNIRLLVKAIEEKTITEVDAARLMNCSLNEFRRMRQSLEQLL